MQNNTKKINFSRTGFRSRIIDGEGVTTTLSTKDITARYDSKIPLIASRRIYKWDKVEEIEKQNAYDFIDPEAWYVSHFQYVFRPDRVGIKGFWVVRLDIFDALWRKPISPREHQFQIAENTGGVFTILGPNNEFSGARCFSLSWDDSEYSLNWLYKNNILMYPFTDSDRMFPNAEDELAYIADVMNRKRGKVDA